VTEELSQSQPHHRPRVIGVTGNIACGKSTVLNILQELGAETIDADLVYRELIAPGEPLWQALRERFGEEVLGPDGAIDRKVLGRIVFSDPQALRDLDHLTHPAVIAAIRAQIAMSSNPVVAVDAVKLIESGMNALCDAVWLVTCSERVQLERLMRRNQLSEPEARLRIDAQPSLEAKRGVADLMIDNSGSLDETRRRVQKAWDRLMEPAL
jgi:dephospho-CoA kinase